MLLTKYLRTLLKASDRKKSITWIREMNKKMMEGKTDREMDKQNQKKVAEMETYQPYKQWSWTQTLTSCNTKIHSIPTEHEKEK